MRPERNRPYKIANYCSLSRHYSGLQRPLQIVRNRRALCARELFRRCLVAFAGKGENYSDKGRKNTQPAVSLSQQLCLKYCQTDGGLGWPLMPLQRF